MDEAFFFKDADEGVFVRVQGHVTASRCPELKGRIFFRLDKAPVPAAVYFDLSDCEYMDSTFLGLIVGVNKRYKLLARKCVKVLHANPTCMGLLRTIGVTRLVDISDEDIALPGDMEEIGPSTRATAEFILDAHENLSELSEENRNRFATLTRALRDSTDKKKED